ncbi:hypothetical protein ACFLZS_00595 [Patescibacteria group bacterium]
MDKVDLKKQEERLIEIAMVTTELPINGDKNRNNFQKVPTLLDTPGLEYVGVFVNKANTYRDEFWETIDSIVDTDGLFDPDFLAKKSMEVTRIIALISYYGFPQFNKMTAPDSEMGATRN